MTEEMTTMRGGALPPLRWNGDALAELVAELVAGGSVRVSTSRSTTVRLDAVPWERLVMIANQVEVARRERDTAPAE